MSFLHSKTFAYIKNFIIGIGAAVVLMGALFKLESWEYASEMLIIGLSTEAFIFLFLGILGPEPTYYWDKLYPGLDDYNAELQPLANTAMATNGASPLNGEVVEAQLGGMLSELQIMSKSLSSLKSLQEADFSGMSEQVRTMTNFYSKINEAMADMIDAAEDTRHFKNNMEELNRSLTSLNTSYSTLNQVYGNMITAMSNVGHR